MENPDKYEEALHGVCHWEQSPSEVNMKAFETWIVEEMQTIDAENVRWMDVFCKLFL
jgi:hypothetical protein